MPVAPGRLNAVRATTSGLAIRSLDDAGGATQGDHGDVVLLLVVRAGEGVQGLEQPVQQVAAGIVEAQGLAQPVEAEHLARRVVRLDEAVAVEQDVAVGGDRRLGLLVDDARHEPKRHARGAQLGDVVAAAHEGQVVAGVGEHDVPGRRIEDREQAGHEHACRHLRAEQVVGPRQDLARGEQSRRLGAQHGVRPGHHQRGRDALVGHVTDGDADPAVAHLDEVVEVAADRAGRAVVRGDLPLRQVRQLAWQELLLDERGDTQLLGEALAIRGFGGLLADELGDADGGRGLGREGRQQPAIVGRVVLLRESRPQVERSDQLALA